MQALTQADKLDALMQKAVESGYEPEDWVQGPQHLAQSLMHMDRVNSVIFNHKFAKALFGEEDLELNYDKALVNAQFKLFSGTIFSSIGTLPAFQAHTMLAVVSNDPIGYMYGAVFGE